MSPERPRRGQAPGPGPTPPEVARLVSHHGLEVPPGLLAEARRLVARVPVLPDAEEARALDLIDQALGHLRLAGRPGPLAAADLEAVAELWTRGGDAR